jgi:nitrogenase-stabilizing/protective protein
MSRLAEFKSLTDTEEYFEFFDLEYDERLVYVKRFHILKKYGEMIEKAEGNDFGSEAKLLDYYKFALITVY